MKFEGTPRECGFRMPAEWGRHKATWLAWPHNASDWPGKFGAIGWVYCSIVLALTRVEEVHICVEDAGARAAGMLRRAGVDLSRVHFHAWGTNRVWVRDSGPIFVTRPGGDVTTAVTNWKFNAWAKYEDWQRDDALPGRVAEWLEVPMWTPAIGGRQVVLEGGSIDVNGAGVLITTEECLLSSVQARNPGLSRGELEGVFQDYLGIEQVIWLGRGTAGDDTHGHVDDITRFVGENVIVTATEADKSDANYEPLAENLERLRSARNLAGGAYEIVELPMPRAVYFDGQRLPASYANFYIANGVVLAPTFNDARDREALGVLAGVFPGREVVGIHCGDLVWGLGALHCMTQQQPG